VGQLYCTPLASMDRPVRPPPHPWGTEQAYTQHMATSIRPAPRGLHTPQKEQVSQGTHRLQLLVPLVLQQPWRVAVHSPWCGKHPPLQARRHLRPCHLHPCHLRPCRLRPSCLWAWCPGHHHPRPSTWTERGYHQTKRAQAQPSLGLGQGTCLARTKAVQWRPSNNNTPTLHPTPPPPFFPSPMPGNT
jgi:hypothetical protein